MGPVEPFTVGPAEPWFNWPHFNHFIVGPHGRKARLILALANHPECVCPTIGIIRILPALYRTGKKIEKKFVFPADLRKW